MWEPTREAALRALDDFADKAGREYATRRNYDFGPDDRSHVSQLSPWIRLRLLSEAEVIDQALARHSRSAADKFIQEVCWRTYWKGWLHLRPTVWTDYLEQLKTDRETHRNDDVYAKAVNGESGIDCVDAWVRELKEHGYLHNHARMWFASIWTHTLKLPWTLGAHLFFQYLLDGDAASNTLSWRWVAGLHTKGKSYLARRDNIRKYTDGRFDLSCALAEEPIDWSDAGPDPQPRPLPELPKTHVSGRTGLLLTEDDLSALDWLQPDQRIDCIAGLLPIGTYDQLGVRESVTDFRRTALRSVLDGAGADYLANEPGALAEWAEIHRLRHILMAEPAVGIWDNVTTGLKKSLAEKGIELHLRRHPWDEAFYPHATAGYFKFRKSLPKNFGAYLEN